MEAEAVKLAWRAKPACLILQEDLTSRKLRNTAFGWGLGVKGFKVFRV